LNGEPQKKLSWVRNYDLGWKKAGNGESPQWQALAVQGGEKKVYKIKGNIGNESKRTPKREKGGKESA